MEEWGVLFEAEVLPRMDPTSRAVLAQVNRAGRDAVRLPAHLACAGRTVGVKLKLVDFVGSAGRLAFALANGCPWEARTCAFVARGGRGSTAVRGTGGRAGSPLSAGTCVWWSG